MERSVILDPGHGGQAHPGAIAATGLQEKDVVLDVSLKVEQYLKRFGRQVLMTRRTDVHISLDGRVSFARHNVPPGVVFVSIHANAASYGAEGIEVWHPNDINETHEYAGGVALAFLLQRYLYMGTRDHYRGCKYKTEEREEFRVLRLAPVPAALAEIGFLSHPRGAQLLAEQWYREKIALSLTSAIEHYLAIPPGEVS